MTSTNDVPVTAEVNPFGSLDELAKRLGIPRKHLTFLQHAAQLNSAYRSWEIPKKSGGTRTIEAPSGKLYLVQRDLSQLLQDQYVPRHGTHGFVRGRNVVSNATPHAGRRYVLNVDLKNFFPSIHAGRVFGALRAYPIKASNSVAELITRLCVKDNHLPIGAPTSPVIANIVCIRMDVDLQRLARRFGCQYTRYADDLTFSTNRAVFPAELAVRKADGKTEVGKELLKAISAAGFAVNSSKVRLQTRGGRQLVTGLSVADKLNVQRKFVRQIRGMLHVWNKYGIEAAQAKLDARQSARRHGRAGNRNWDRVVEGKIGYLAMVRGHNDPMVRRFRAQYQNLRTGQPINTGLVDGQAPGRMIRILHLSDFHFTASADWDSGRMFSRLVQILEQELAPDFVVLTGDVAKSGIASEYLYAERKLQVLLTALGLDRTKLLVVPGNHDVDRRLVSANDEAVRASIDASSDPDQRLADMLADEHESAGLRKRFTDYLAFTEDWLGWSASQLWWKQELDVRGEIVTVVGIATPLFSSSDDDAGHLRIGLAQVNDLMNDTDPGVRVCLMHHPFSYSHPNDQAAEQEIRQWADIILRGHLHQESVVEHREGDVSVVTVAAGAAYQGSEWVNGFHYLDVDLGNASVLVQPFRWDPGHRRWFPSRDVFDREIDGTKRFALPRLARGMV